MAAGTQLAGATQIVVAIGDLATPNANTVNVLSGGTIAVTILSGSAASTATGGSSNINVVQIAGTVVSGQGNGVDAVTTTAGTMPATAYVMAWSSNANGWMRIQDASSAGAIGAAWNGYMASALIYGDSTPSPRLLQGANVGDAATTGRQAIWALAAPMLYNGSNHDRARSALGTLGIPSVNTEGTLATYSASIAQAAFSAASGTDVFLINGSATAVIRVTRVEVSFTSLQPVNIPLSWVRRSAVTTAGTSARPTMVIHDTSNAAASAVVVNYTNTAGQAPGTPRGPIRSAVVAATLASVGSDTPWVSDFSTRNTQAMILRGTSEILALTISSGGATTGTSNISVNIEWSEALQ